MNPYYSCNDRLSPMKNEKLRNARNERGFTQRQLADKVGVAKITVRKWEDGTRSPSSECRDLLCQVLGKTEAQLGLDNFLKEATPASPPLLERPIQGEENRKMMIRRVQALWISGALDHSLAPGTLIHLYVQEQTDAVLNPWAEFVQESNLPPQTQPLGIHITQIYDNADEAFLLLGEPGAGKTTLLLELTRDLLSRARADETHPIPVVFNLSSWAQKRQSIQNWMIEELSSKYQVPHKLAEEWVAANQILPLLDGLDEVARIHCKECVETINAYRKEHGFLPMVVCCRSEEYLDLDARIALNKAITILPLAPHQIEQYIRKEGKRLEAVATALSSDASLREMASTPLMLTIISLTFRDTSLDTLLSIDDPIQRRTLIFEKYVEVVLRHRGSKNRYSSEQTRRWLAWLAQQLQKHNQAEFYLERMQPDWLPDNQSRQRYQSIVIRLIYGSNSLLFAALFGWIRGGKTAHGSGVGEGLLGWLGAGRGNQVLGWMAPGLGGGVGGGGTVVLVLGIASILIWITITTGTLETDWSHIRKSLAKGVLDSIKVVVIIGASTDLLFGIANSASTGFSHGLAYSLIGGLVAGLYNTLVALKPDSPPDLVASSREKRLVIFDAIIIALCSWCGFAIVDIGIGASADIRIGAIVGLLTGLLFLFSSSKLMLGRDPEIKPAEVATWSWRKIDLIRSAKKGLTIGLVIMIGTAILIGLASQIFHGFPYGLVYGLVYGPILGLITATASTLTEILHSGWSSDLLSSRQFIQPNEGIHRSARNSLFAAVLFGPIGGIASGLGCGLAFGLLGRLQGWPILATGFSIVFGILFALYFWNEHGGTALIKHFLLRFQLARAGSIPWDYIRFLNYAAERILLRRIGGGYMFVHHMLLDHFANLNNTEQPEHSNRNTHR